MTDQIFLCLGDPQILCNFITRSSITLTCLIQIRHKLGHKNVTIVHEKEKEKADGGHTVNRRQ